MALGKLSLNLTGCNPGSEGGPSPVAVTAADTIAKLVPRSHLMPLSLTTLNQASIAPRKDYVSNRYTLFCINQGSTIQSGIYSVVLLVLMVL